MGYRWYDKHSVKPAFPFGHGLTYGAVKYTNLKVSGRTVTFTMQVWPGPISVHYASPCDTAQVYIGYPDAGKDPAVPSKVRGRGRRRVIILSIYIRWYTATDRAAPSKVVRCTIISYPLYTLYTPSLPYTTPDTPLKHPIHKGDALLPEGMLQRVVRHADAVDAVCVVHADGPRRV